jgi:hypothetical protein
MRALRWFVLLAGLLPLILHASPALKENMSFVKARALLLKDKWQPVYVHENDDYALMGVERELAKRNFKEFDSCSIDYSNCIMRYKRGGECLTLHTIGEKVKYMKVVQWTKECPGGKAGKGK